MKVSDIFYSIQGEGTFFGRATIFIRLYGCNLECSFCDDEKHIYISKEYSIDEILDEISQYSSKEVVITGGEPSLNDINEFIKSLQQKGYHVAIETNGYNFENIKKANWITYSPKDWNDIKKEGYSELKFIVNIDSDISKVLNFKTIKPIFIQPQNYKDKPDMKNNNFCIELVKTHPHLRLSLQAHKFLGVE